jgi:hypothetical protein
MPDRYVDSTAAGAGVWAGAYATLAAAFAASSAGDDIFVAHDHAETAGATKTLTSPGTPASPCKVICANKTSGVRPVAADFATTATVTATGAFNIAIDSGDTYYYGINFFAGTGAGNQSLTIANTCNNKFENCSFNVASTGSTSSMTLGGPTILITLDFVNCTFTFATTGGRINVNSGKKTFRGGSFCATGTVPTGALFRGGNRDGINILEGVDLSAFNSGKILADFTTSQGGAWLTLKDCKLASGVVVVTSGNIGRGSRVDVINSDDGDTNYRTERHANECVETTVITPIRTGGASNGTTTIARRLASTANASIYYPYRSFDIVGWHDSEGSNITVTIEGLADPRHFSALPTSAEIWFDLEYMGTASNPLGVIKSGRPATVLTTGSAHSASTEAWDSAATARANTTAYSLGDVIKVASNPGRVFICTTAGTSNGSEPAGYASAVDGGSVTDNGATFKAAWRFKMAVTTTAAPQNKGPLYATPHMAKASSVLFIDPKLTVA